jgi:hypothetical protein
MAHGGVFCVFLTNTCNTTSRGAGHIDRPCNAVTARHADFPQLPRERSYMRHTNTLRTEVLEHLGDVQKTRSHIRWQSEQFGLRLGYQFDMPCHYNISFLLCLQKTSRVRVMGRDSVRPQFDTGSRHDDAFHASHRVQATAGRNRPILTRAVTALHSSQRDRPPAATQTTGPRPMCRLPTPAPSPAPTPARAEGQRNPGPDGMARSRAYRRDRPCPIRDKICPSQSDKTIYSATYRKVIVPKAFQYSSGIAHS